MKTTRTDRARAFLSLRKFLYVNDPEFRAGIRWGALGFLLAIVGIIVRGLSDWLTLSTILTAISVGLALYGIWKGSKISQTYRPSLPGHSYSLRESKGFLIDNREVQFRDLLPSQSEQHGGLRVVPISTVTDETAHASSRIDDGLVLCDKIPCQVGPDRSGQVLANSAQQRRCQLLYLVTKVSDPSRTTNDAKLILSSSPMDLPKKAKVCKGRYFDGLMTNEAYRTDILEGPSGSPHEALARELPRRYFPAHKDRGDEPSLYRLDPLPIEGISSHVGVTTLALTSNGHPVIFQQDATMAIGAGRLVFGGSGSMDYSDIRKCDKVDDLLAAVRYGMARELCEEGKIFSIPGPERRQQRTLDIARRTKVIGFFRWVDRSGKPEFLGVTRLPFARGAVAADGDEVVEIDWPSSTRLQHPEDAEDLLRQFESSRRVLNLSSYCVLRHLIEIGSYRKSEDASKQVIYAEVDRAMAGVS